MNVRPTNPFLRNLKRLPEQDALAVAQALELFASDPHAPSLNFEKVTRRKGFFTIRGNYSIRILLQKTATDAYDAVAVGNHDYVYASYFKK
jgi:hypothetical protein